MAASAKPVPIARQQLLLPAAFAAAFGAFLGLALLKFGNPPIMEKFTTPPTNVYEVVLGSPWPIAWAYRLLAVVAVLGLFLARRKEHAPLWLVLLPLVWLFWQFVATVNSIDARLSNPTLAHFVACAICFYLGFFSLSRVQRLGWFWAGLVLGFVFVVLAGWQQHFGGLEATRKYFFLYIYPQQNEVAPEYLKKLASNRIFSTLFYPNALAGALLLLLPVMLGLVWKVRQYFTPAADSFLACLVAMSALACLYWSGSKGGWLFMLGLAAITFLFLRVERRFKATLVVVLLLLGGAGFALKYAGFFQKGATSVVARFDYWRAGIEIAGAHPFVGSGPGTFALTYERIKRPEAEMSRLVHNDYLEQACDSGIPGFLAYVAFVINALIWSAPARINGWRISAGNSPSPVQTMDWFRFAVWLGCLGWALQALVEFNLYLPALAWPAFALLGWLLGSASPNSDPTPRAG